MKHEVPNVTFRVYPLNACPEWLVKKKDKFEANWARASFGKRFVTRITKTCNLSFPSQITRDGIEVTFSKHSRRIHGDSVGSVEPTNPSRVSLFAERKDTRKTLLSTLCHELIHSLMWSTYYFDNRRRPVSFFADAFSDELITTLLEEAIIQGSFKKIDFEGALDYAREETYCRLKNLKRSKQDYEKIIEEIKSFFKESRKAIKQGSNALKERERALLNITIPPL